MTKLLIIFIVISIVNVILQTTKSIATIKCGAFMAALVNAIAYFVYTFVIIYTNCELGMFIKATITAVANFVGVYVVKYIEKRTRKDKLWKIEATVPWDEAKIKAISTDCEEKNIPYYYQHIGDYAMFTFFAEAQSDSLEIKKICKIYRAKFFVSEQNAKL